jgi:hypothetical protein
MCAPRPAQFAAMPGGEPFEGIQESFVGLPVS